MQYRVTLRSAKNFNYSYISGTDVPSVAADLLSELMDAASNPDSGSGVTEELLSVANAMVANVASDIVTPVPSSLVDVAPGETNDPITTPTASDSLNLEKLHLECQALHEEIQDHIEMLREQLPYNTKLTSFEALRQLWKCLNEDVLSVPSSKVSFPLQCWITLSKLRLNLHDQDLAYSFSIGVDTVKKVFNDCATVLAKQWTDDKSADSLSDEILKKEFLYLKHCEPMESSWKACRFIDSYVDKTFESDDNILYSTSFSEVWGSVGPERTASQLQKLLTIELKSIVSVVQVRPSISVDQLQSCDDAFLLFYSGFSDYDSLHDVLNVLLPGPTVQHSTRADLSPFHQFLCVLLRLVRDLSKEEILLRLPKKPESEDSVEELCNKQDPDVEGIISLWLPYIHSRLMQVSVHYTLYGT